MAAIRSRRWGPARGPTIVTDPMRHTPTIRLARRILPTPVRRRIGDLARTNRFLYRMKVRELARRCDVFLISYPKCGRTWLRYMIGEYLRRHYAFGRRRVMRATKASIERPGMPRILVTHDDEPQVKLPEHVLTDKRPYRGTKVIFLVRDPRDVLVSYYHHRTKRTAGDHRFVGSLEEFLAPATGHVEALIAFYNAWAAQRHHPEGFLLVRYEDLLSRPRAELRRVLTFCGVTDVDPASLRKAVRAGAFDRMQALERRGELPGRSLRPGDPSDPDSFKVRRGGIGGHRTALDGATRADLDIRLRALDPLYSGYRA
jgi:hypothetical protein